MTDHPARDNTPFAGQCTVRVFGRPNAWGAYVSLDDSDEIRVRFRGLPNPARFRCDECGPTLSPGCIHARIAVAIGSILRGQPA